MATIATSTIATKFNTTEPFQCKAESTKWQYVLLMPLPLIAGLVNLVVWLAATIYRRKFLRQNYVYISVTSTLLSNVVFLCFHLWDEIDGYKRPAQMSEMSPSYKMQILWTLCQSAAVSMLFVMCGNLLVLIYVMLDSTYFQKSVRHRSTSTSSVHVSRSTQRTLDLKRRKAILLVTFSWVLPITLTIIAVLNWNCASLCHCNPGSVGEICPRHMGCSRVWAPLSNSFMGVNIGLWMLEVVSLVALTLSGIKNFQDFTGTRPSSRSRVHTRSMAISSVTGSREFDKLDPRQNYESNSTVIYDEKSTKNNANPPHEDEVFKARVTTTRKYFATPRLRLVALLNAVFIACTIPVAVAFFIDVSDADFAMPAVKIPAMVSVHLYTLICPLLLVKYMSNLRTALNRFFGSICCCL